MLVTAGFRDILDMGFEQRYDLFDLRLTWPDPLAPRRLRREVRERVGHDGQVLAALDLESTRAAIRDLVETAGVEAFAICFLHSYANPVHEEAAGELVRAEFPDLHVSRSAEVFGNMREYASIAGGARARREARAQGLVRRRLRRVRGPRPLRTRGGDDGRGSGRQRRARVDLRARPRRPGNGGRAPESGGGAGERGERFMSTHAIDAVSLSIMWDRLVGITDEIISALIRSSFSTIVRESGDLSVVVLDTEGNSIAQGSYSVPSFTGTAATTLRHMLAKFPPDSLEPGDVIATNDAWMGTGHLFDINVMRPVFRNGRIAGYTMSITHLPDIGGLGFGAAAERFVRRLLDTRRTEVFVSGSSAALLSREIASSLRGRAWPALIHPFSFEEACRHRGIPVPERPDILARHERLRPERTFAHWLRVGGFPEAQGLGAPSRHQLLRDYVDVAILRDVVDRHRVTMSPACDGWRGTCSATPAACSASRSSTAGSRPRASPSPGIRCIRCSASWTTASWCGWCRWSRAPSASAWSTRARHIPSTRDSLRCSTPPAARISATLWRPRCSSSWRDDGST